MNDLVTIETLGHQGDGIGQMNKGRVFVPLTLAGEVVEVSGTSNRRQLVRVIQAADTRIEPTCRHFGTCGGCQLQHFALEPYLEWKRQLVENALAGENIAVTVEPVIHIAGSRRRRAVFTASHSKNGIDLGFSEKASHNIVNLEECPVLVAEISTQIETIRNVVRAILPAKGTCAIHVLASESGLDVHVEATGAPNETNRRAAIRAAIEGAVARLSFGDDILVENKRPQLRMGIARVYPPAGSFVQASAEAQSAMVEIVKSHLKPCKKVADLFCGIGTFALPLAESSVVFACENEASALESLNEAWRSTGGKLKAIDTQKRDLNIRPVMADELKKMQGVVFDPPRSGAQAQAQQLARSKVKRIAAVSCNPSSLARDLTILIKGGYKISRIIPIEQFSHTPHVEVVALLAR